MALDRQRIGQYLNTYNLRALFTEELGWDNCKATLQSIMIDRHLYTLQAIAQKRGMVIYTCGPDSAGHIPDDTTRMMIEKELAKLHYEHIIIYTDRLQSQQLWQWVRREPGHPLVHREVPFHKGRSNDLLIQRLERLAFDLAEEEKLGIAEVALRARQAFDVESVTRRFYDRFQVEHAAFFSFIQGITSLIDREWYASLMLNRLMFVYFIQKKGFLDKNTNYLPDKLRMMQERIGKNRFLSFYRHFLLRLFHEGLGTQKHRRPSDLDALLGDVPYLNGGLFEVHELERGYTNIQIPDEAFKRIFAFFDSYQWLIDEQPLRSDGEINPDVIGYIFEKYINQKQMGAYYTEEDITEYISKNTIIPYIFNATQQQCQTTFGPDSAIWHLLRINPDRYIPADLRDEGYLPTETEQGYTNRRTRYTAVKTMLISGKVTSINDLITYNLDICRFAQDVITHCQDASLLQAFYQSIEKIAILDPTCGSGAFLFAALNILEPLYAACLDSMKRMVETSNSYFMEDEHHGPDHMHLDFFRSVLKQVDLHPNRTYFILKAITINSLYGVDIMREAVEICKLRLFLKLVAQLQKVEEPLPDIDFNICSGNTLVGFAHYDEVKKAVLGHIQGKIDFDDTMGSIEQEAQAVEREFAHYRKLQTQLDPLPDDTSSRKRHLRSIQKALRIKLDRYLASTYGTDLHHISQKEDYEQAFERWQRSHQPLHWFIMFYGIMERGGFDVIIGNPPYVEYSKVRQDYKVQGYETESCGNLYAAVIERSLALCRPGQSYIGLIVPLSICGGERFEQLRSTITNNTAAAWLANFEIFPSRLFDGAFQRLSIFIAKHGSTQKCVTHVTRIQRWYASERAHLIDLISYTIARRTVRPHVFPKLASPLQEAILQKVLEKAKGERIAKMLHPHRTEHFVYYQEATNYWMKATCRIPFYKKDGLMGEPSHGRFLFFRDEVTAQVIMALMNSSLFYVWFATFSDGFHLSHTLVKEFPTGSTLYAVKELPLLAAQLEEDIRAHARMSTRNTKPKPGQKGHAIELEEYRMSYSKPLLDVIDSVLAAYYDLTNEELNFIINYDIKYRMGRDNDDQGT